MQRLQCNNITWIDLQNPSAADIGQLQKDFGIHEIVAAELTIQSYRARVEDYETHLYMVLRMPIVHRKDSPPGASREIDFIIGKDFLITVHKGKIAELQKMQEELTESRLHCAQSFGSSPVNILHAIISRLFTDLLEDLDHFGAQIDGIERKIFKDPDKEVVEDISVLRHTILNFRRALKPQQTVLESLATRGATMFGAHNTAFLRDILGEYSRVWDIIENHKETLDALNDTHTSLLSTKSTEVIQKLTLMAFVTFPLTLIASVFGMNTKYLPIVGRTGDFWIIFSIMLIGVTGMILYFHKKRWL